MDKSVNMSVYARGHIRAEQRRFRRASEGRAWSVKELPRYYYHRNFCDMLTHVSTRYTDIMEAEHTAFIRDFEALPFHTQCTYARLAGRKGTIFNRHHFNYPEIEDIPAQFDILAESGFIRGIQDTDLGEHLNALTKPEITDLLAESVCETQYKRSWKKAKLVDIATDHLNFEDLSNLQDYFVQSRLDAFNYLLFLYFGKIETSLQSKTLGALGLVKPAKSNIPKKSFQSAAHAKASYFYSKALSDFGSLNYSELCHLSDSVETWPDPVDEANCLNRGKLIEKLGRHLERQGQLNEALQLYAHIDNAACNERVVRIRYARNEGDDRDWSRERLEGMIENPENENELVFAQDFYQRKFKKKRTSKVTDLLRESKIIYLDEAFKNAPERAVLIHYKEKGLEVYRTENRPWKTLFGLLFWDEIFREESPSGWRTPNSLKTGSFYDKHETIIEEKLAKLNNHSETTLHLLKTMAANYGELNGVFIWGSRSLDRIKALIKNAPHDALAGILRLMAKDFVNMNDGFPDLMLVENGGLRFIEVKAEGDVLRRNQLTRIQQLRTAGFKAEILRVGWHIDPHQTYVVVDVETTGGRAGLHRVTEIGAIKIQSGEIVDEWSSLINPQRSIPPNITRITGIDYEMIKDAPVFAEIADSFEAFMGDAIFAAHNVNFDYGFISAEFQMIDRKFSHPKICTCSSMRKLYPGYKSYGLKNLCQEFQIDLKTHHRALCDAKAAAELLKMINDKRLDMQSDA